MYGRNNGARQMRANEDRYNMSMRHQQDTSYGYGRGKDTAMDMVKTGFFTGMGFILINIVISVIGLILALVGAYLAYREWKKPKDKRSEALFWTGAILAVIGLIMMGGIMLVFLLGAGFETDIFAQES
jgi:4-hydroxybenzoate polyprenyltransferase